MYELLIKELNPNNGNIYSCNRETSAKLLSHWICMAILSMTNLTDFKVSVKSVKKGLLEKLDQKLTEEAFSEILLTGFLKEEEDGTIKRLFTSHSTKTDIKHEGTQAYVSLVCDLAKKQISTLFL